MLFDQALLQRVIQVRLSQTDLGDQKFTYGTGFVVDVSLSQYVITATHLYPIESLPEGVKWNFQFRHNRQWRTEMVDLSSSRSKGDLLVFKLQTPILVRNNISYGGEGLYLGQEVWFAGFPDIDDLHEESNYGLPTPHVRHGWVESGKDDTYRIDAIAAGGYSGGPVIYRDGPTEQVKLLGIVSSTLRDGRRFSIVNDQGAPVPGLYFHPSYGVNVVGVGTLLNEIASQG